MKRSDLLRNKSYWLADIQLNLYSQIEEYCKKNKMNKAQLAQKLGVSKGYISQVLNGDFDHKLSKLIDLSLAINKVPVIAYYDLDKYIRKDAEIKSRSGKPSVKAMHVIKQDQPGIVTRSKPKDGNLKMRYKKPNVVIN